MNLKNYLFGIFAFLTFTAFSQAKKSSESTSQCTITEYKIEVDNLKELEDIDWNSVYTIFENNNPESYILLLVGFSEKKKVRNLSIEKWSFTISGKTSELDSMIKKSKYMISKYTAARKTKTTHG